jgi:hypothetical protein
MGGLDVGKRGSLEAVKFGLTSCRIVEERHGNLILQWFKFSGLDLQRCDGSSLQTWTHNTAVS